MNPTDIACNTLLEPAALAEGSLDRVLGGLLGPSIDAADLYFESSRLESWVLEDGIIKEGNHSIEQGAGVRAISGEKTGFAYSDEIRNESLLEAARAARAIARGGAEGRVRIARASRHGRSLYAPLSPLGTLTEQEKVELLRAVDAAVRRADPRVSQVMVSLVAAHDVVLVASTDGALHGDVRPLVRLNVSVIVEHDGRREQGSSGGGARRGLDFFIEQDRALGYAREAVRQALTNLEAVHAPAGPMTVVLGPGWPGVLLHEAVGHGLEGDFNRKGTSAFAGRIGEKVASGLCTVVDDGTLEGRRGSLNIDDEGTPSQRTVLIENGRLRGYMQDRLNARLTGQTPTGNGPDVLTRVSMVGNDLALDEGIGTCGKEGQSVPVGVGQPTLRVERLTVGGTSV